MALILNASAKNPIYIEILAFPCYRLFDLQTNIKKHLQGFNNWSVFVGAILTVYSKFTDSLCSMVEVLIILLINMNLQQIQELYEIRFRSTFFVII